MLPALLVPILAKLAESGLTTLAGAIQAKGKEVIEEKLGVKIPEKAEELTPELLQQLKIKEMEHEQFLIGAALDEKRIDAEAEKHAGSQVTERWKADMSSDSWLSKNIRPITLIALLVMLAGVLVADGFGAKFQDRVTSLLELALSIVLTAYFVGRTVEKGISVVQDFKTRRASVPGH